MNIILAVQRAGGEHEYSFNKDVVLIGRDAVECDIAFNGARHPMVSRKHAELRYQGGRWLVADLNSSYGTYFNGARIAQPTQIHAGNTIRLGTDGPVFRVVWFEESADPTKEFTPSVKPQVETAREQIPVPEQNLPNATVTPQVAQPNETAQLEFVGTPERPRLTVTKPSIWLGREPSCDCVFDGSSATVSRRHAEIKLENGGYLLIDNNSFNGTLLNEQRLSSSVPLYHGDEIRLGIGGPVLRFNSPSRKAPAGSSLAGQRAVAESQSAIPANAEETASKTVVFRRDSTSERMKSDSAQPQLLMSITFGDKKELTIGRD